MTAMDGKSGGELEEEREREHVVNTQAILVVS